jgi:hypothetical protein
VSEISYKPQLGSHGAVVDPRIMQVRTVCESSSIELALVCKFMKKRTDTQRGYPRHMLMPEPEVVRRSHSKAGVAMSPEVLARMYLTGSTWAIGKSERKSRHEGVAFSGYDSLDEGAVVSDCDPGEFFTAYPQWAT